MWNINWNKSKALRDFVKFGNHIISEYPYKNMEIKRFEKYLKTDKKINVSQILCLLDILNIISYLHSKLFKCFGYLAQNFALDH